MYKLILALFMIQSAWAQPAVLPPCDAGLNGTNMVVLRDPTDAEKTADAAMAGPPRVLLQSADLMNCNSGNWTLVRTTPRYQFK